jgi:hypothetical protein
MSVRDLSEIYNDPQSNMASQTTLTDKPLDSSSNQSNHRQDQSWTQPVSKTSDIEREPSVKSSNFLDDSTTYPPSVYQCDIKRASSIATAISMRRAEIITSRDNSQHPHNMLMRDEEETIMEEYPSSSGSSYKKHKNGTDQLLLYEQKKSIIILLGRLLMKCGCPCHRVVCI